MFEARKEDEAEHESITQFLTAGCKCEMNCCKKFRQPYYELQRNQCAELSHESLDIAIMAQLMAFGGRDERKIANYMHLGEKVNIKHQLKTYMTHTLILICVDMQSHFHVPSWRRKETSVSY